MNKYNVLGGTTQLFQERKYNLLPPLKQNKNSKRTIGTCMKESKVFIECKQHHSPVNLWFYLKLIAKEFISTVISS
jgi:hypothetical protein